MIEGLNNGIHYYRSHQYDIALKQFSLLVTKENISQEQKAIINIWLGRCYFMKTELRMEYPPVLKKFSHESFLEKPYPVSKRMTRKALEYFNAALQQNPQSSKANFWKGKVLKYDGSTEQAYECFVRALVLSGKQKYRDECARMFAENKHFSFPEIILANLIAVEEVLMNCSSSCIYTRMEACQHISMLPSATGERLEIQKAISPLAGYKLLCCYLPFTGDPDNRVKQIAREILLLIKE